MEKNERFLVRNLLIKSDNGSIKELPLMYVAATINHNNGVKMYHLTPYSSINSELHSTTYLDTLTLNQSTILHSNSIIS